MENATKALLMAVGVLIGILILTAFIVVFRKGGQILATVDNKETSEDIAEYNSKLVIYNRIGDTNEDGIIDSYNTIFDVVTACNLAYQINNENQFDIRNYLIIEFYDSEGYSYNLENKSTQKSEYIGNQSLKELIRKYGERIQVDPTTDEWDYKYKFKGTTYYDEQTGKINKIIFEQI